MPSKQFATTWVWYVLLMLPATMLYCSLEALSSTTSRRLRKLLPLPATMYKYLALTELAQEPCVVCDDVGERSACSKVNVRSEVCGDVDASDDDDALLIVAAFDRARLPVEWYRPSLLIIF